MKNRVFKVLTVISLVCAMTLSGCGKSSDDLESKSKEELIELCEYYLDCYTEASLELDDAKLLLETIQGYSSTGPSFSAMTIENNKLSFNSYDSKIIFPKEFNYPGATETAANTLVRVTDLVSINPGTNWIMKLSGSTLEMEHTTNISTMIKIGEFEELYDRNKLKEEVMMPWFEDISSSVVKYSTIFVSGDNWGIQAQAPIQIDGEDAYLVCGIVGFAETSITYVSTYRGKQDINKDGTINSLINSIMIGGNNLVVSND